MAAARCLLAKKVACICRVADVPSTAEAFAGSADSLWMVSILLSIVCDTESTVSQLLEQNDTIQRLQQADANILQKFSAENLSVVRGGSRFELHSAEPQSDTILLTAH